MLACRPKGVASDTQQHGGRVCAATGPVGALLLLLLLQALWVVLLHRLTLLLDHLKVRGELLLV